MDTRLSIDWISCTSHGRLKNGFRFCYPTLTNHTQWEAVKGMMGYDNAYRHTTGVLMLKSSKREDMGTHIVHSGKALSRINERWQRNALSLLEFYVNNGASIARVDIAVDIYNSGMDIASLAKQLKSKKCVTRSKSGLFIESMDGQGDTLYVGSIKKRKKLLRIYDKGAESGVGGDWIRVEYEVHGKPATQASIEIIESIDRADTMIRIVKGYADFPDDKIWDEIFGGVAPVYLGSQTSSDGDTEDWLMNTVAKVVGRRVALDDTFLSRFMERVAVFELVEGTKSLLGK